MDFVIFLVYIDNIERDFLLEKNKLKKMKNSEKKTKNSHNTGKKSEKIG